MGHADAICRAPKGDELVTNGTKVRGYDPATGALLWTLAPNSEIAIGTPVVHRDLAIVTAGYPPVRPVYAVRAGSRGDISLPAGKSTQRRDRVEPRPRRHLHFVADRVSRSALHAKQQRHPHARTTRIPARRLYRARVGGGGAFSASPVASDGKLYLASEDGDVFVIQAGTRIRRARQVSDERA